MSALDGVLADLIEADCDCAYVTIKREPLEALIEEWARRGDRIALFCGLLTRARDELAQAWATGAEQPHLISPNAARESTLRALDAAVAESASGIAHHRHAVRWELAARLKLVLRSAIGARCRTPSRGRSSQLPDCLQTGSNRIVARTDMPSH